MDLPEYNADLHNQKCFYFGIPVFEHPDIDPGDALVVRVPIPEYDNAIRFKILVRSIREFENQIWIDRAVREAVESNMGDVLKWLNGGKRPRYRLTNSTSSRISKQLSSSEAAVLASKSFASAMIQASEAVAGLSTKFRAIGSMVTQHA